MKIPSLLVLLTASLINSAFAGDPVTEQKASYDLDEVKFENTVVYSGVDRKRPGLLMVPNWMGPTPAAIDKAKQIAGDDYVVMVVDMYGVDTRPTNMDEAGAAATAVRNDRAMMRARAARALKAFKAMAGDIPLDPEKVSAIGFCFGGGTVLELGRSGADLDAIISFHGDLVSPTLEKDAGNTKAKVLVLHGASDPFVPQSDVRLFTDIMLRTDVDWQLVQFSNTVHSFTDPSAKMTGKAEFSQSSNDRAFESMRTLLREMYK